MSQTSQILTVRYNQANGKVSFVFYCFAKLQLLVSLELTTQFSWCFQLNGTLKIPDAMPKPEKCYDFRLEQD